MDTLKLPWAGGLNYAQFSEIDYDFDGKYLVSLYGRRDGSSVLGKNNKYGTFPSFSVGWNISNEEFWKENKFVNKSIGFVMTSQLLKRR